MSKRPGPNKENLEETRKAFIAVAKTEFCTHGYPDASTTRIVTNSGMARGSLYYHFGDKNGLFKAVYEEAMHHAMSEINGKIDIQSNPWDALMSGSDAFLDMCMDHEFRKIILIESQSAMSYGERIMVQEQTLLGLLRNILTPLFEQGYFNGHTLETLLTFIYGILAEIGRSFDFSDNINAARSLHGLAYKMTIEKLK